MPLATNPNKTIPVWLESDADVSMETRPVFLCRFLTRHEINTVSEELDRIPGLMVDEAHARLDALLAKGIVGWRNMTEPVAGALEFAADRFDRVLTPPEKWELAYTMLRAPRMSEVDSKKSSSPGTLPAASSAADAPEASAEKTS